MKITRHVAALAGAVRRVAFRVLTEGLFALALLTVIVAGLVVGTLVVVLASLGGFLVGAGLVILGLPAETVGPASAAGLVAGTALALALFVHGYRRLPWRLREWMHGSR